MEQRFLISTDSAKGAPAGGTTADERNKITFYLEAKGWQVWHWFEDLWLVVTPQGSTTTIALRDEITNLFGAKRFLLVMEIQGPIVYSGYGNGEGWPWMASKWGTPQ